MGCKETHVSFTHPPTYPPTHPPTHLAPIYLAIEFERRDPIPHVFLVSQAVGTEIKQLHIPIIVPSGQHSLCVVVSVAKGDSPAISLFLSFLGNKGQNWSGNAQIPYMHAAIPSASDQLRCAVAGPF